MDRSTAELVTVLGPTAAGKTAFAAHLAHRMGGEIISADSRQVYRGMDIGTGKDYDDYVVGDTRIPAHLVDIVDAGYEYNVYLFKQDFFRVFNEVTGRGVIPVLCGGTGLYIESVLRNYRLLQVPVNKELRRELEEKKMDELGKILKGYAPLHNKTDTEHKKRLIRAIEIAMYQESNPVSAPADTDVNPVVLGVHLERSARRERITARLYQRLEEGLVKEVEGLLDKGVTPEKMEYYGLEYRYVTRYIRNELTYDEMVKRLNTAIHQFSKRQMTYFRGMERRGIRIRWIDGALPMEEKVEKALSII
ncbi:MAG: tRNA (adenosine(37)-N6)-dimethylallyltransferase MiaA [Bacteroidota bacterium]